MSETHEHLEHAEHAGHGNGHAIDPFTLRVAMTMAIIAAVLATITLIGHRKHNEALQRQGDANRLRTEGAAWTIESSNQFAWYQAKRARSEMAQNSIAMTKLLATAPESGKLRDDQLKKWDAYIQKNGTKPNNIKVDAKGYPVMNEKGENDDTEGALIVRGNLFKKFAEEKADEAKEQMKEYHHAHHQGEWLDWAHLAVELGLVLCTICVLTKRREFWILGILAALAGIGLAAYPFLPLPH